MMPADLVVDATGRHSRTPEWLEALGYPAPEETVVNASLGYASRIFRRPTFFEADWEGAFVQAAPPARTRGGALFPIEGDRWIATLIGGSRDHPPTDTESFLEFARSLPTPILYDAIRAAEPLTPIYSHRTSENRVRHYERLRRLPERLIVLGNAATAFNPVSGQGMTAAANAALTLHECLLFQAHRRPGGELTGLARHFQRRLAAANAVPWRLATCEEYRYRETEGPGATFTTRAMQRYLDRVRELTTKDAETRQTMLEVFGLLQPPVTLFRPSILLGALREGVTATAGRTLRASGAPMRTPFSPIPPERAGTEAGIGLVP